MATILLAISGPLRKSEFAVGPEFAIGRDAGNSVRLEDPTVSPHHCRIEIREGQLVLSDLGSRCGTFVNGIPVKERALRPGDEVAVGSSVFVVQVEETASAGNNVAQKREREALDAKALEFQGRELLSLDLESLAALPQPARMARNLNALLQICRAIGSLRDEESLPWQLLSMIFELIPAERGAILLTEEDSSEIRSEVTWDRVFGPEHPVHISGEIVGRVIGEGISLLDSGTLTQKPAEKPMENPIAQNLAGSAAADEKRQRTFLCVPMISEKGSGKGSEKGSEKGAGGSRKAAIGLIYLESSNAGSAFTEDDFQLLTAIAGLGTIGIENARQFERLGSENERLRAEVSLTHDMVGCGPRMRDIYQFIERVAPSDSTVLISGESGTGKELVAAAIHKNSPRKNQPFVALNCAALTETLLESELFGHEKGAFTSAVNQKKGFLEVAEGGTVFLDEIGELSLILQAKLLRVLQEREFMRVGGTRAIKINVRFLAATNKDLQKCAREGTFRADLFHRLNVISIALPSLREHPEDIPDLAEHFTARHAKNCNRGVMGISEQAMACLTQYDWPGNIRELENALERAVVIGSSNKILAEDLPETLLENAKSGGGAPAKYHEAIRNLKRQMILGALDQAGGNVTDAAKLLGVHGNYLHRLMRNFELRPPVKKQTSA